jgi:hypothetical protein
MNGMKRSISPIILALLLPFFLSAQEEVFETFKDTRVINTHSVETLAKRKLDIRIGHRFGDMFGGTGGWPTFYGLENAADILIGADYGVTDDFDIGFSRTKGSASLRQLINGVAKYKMLRQQPDGTPFSLVVVGVGTLSTMEKQENPGSINSFEKFAHRMSYTAQILVGRKFSDAFSLQIVPSYTHRNLVAFEDTNDLFSLGLASRIQMTKVFGLILDATIPLNGAQSPFIDSNDAQPTYYPILGIGLEIDTGGHVFQVNFTNARGLIENDYIPNTTSNWADGEFRLGFTIARTFNL